MTVPLERRGDFVLLTRGTRKLQKKQNKRFSAGKIKRKNESRPSYFVEKIVNT